MGSKRRMVVLPRKEIIAGLRSALAAFDEIAGEWISRRRAANWQVINDGLIAASAALRLVKTARAAGNRKVTPSA